VDLSEREFFITVDIGSGEDQVLDVARLFARNVSQKIR
jgi:hypothetical protein